MMKYLLKKCCSFAAILFLTTLLSSAVNAQTFSTIEVGEGTLPAHTIGPTTQTPFTRIDFIGQFQNPPNVFTITPEFGEGADDDPCMVRIRNITTTGFDAACIEPLNEDRDSPGTTFEYIAIQNGGVNVPLADGSGDVEFVSQCAFVSNQQHNRCSNCGAQSFADINFPSAFNARPSIVTQIQSINNTVQGSATTPGGEPLFINTAVRNVTNNDFDLAIDRLEAGVSGTLNNGETICYLAVERNSCQELNFISLGGPPSIMFQATEATNVNGHDNPACDATNFANGCFASTPLVIADQTTFNGGNGGVARRCETNSNSVTYLIDEDRVSDAERRHTIERVSTLAFSSAFTTPVTLSKAEVNLIGRRAIFKWETSAETFHLGFHLWGETSNGWEQLNRHLIPGKGLDSQSTQTYRFGVRLSRQQANEITNFGISSVDNSGREEFYGPFSEGQSYGERANSEPVDWSATRAAFEQTMRERGFVKINNRWRRASARTQARLKKREQQKQLGLNRAMFDMSFEQVGVHQISANKLIELNPRWNGLALNRIALTLNGQAQPRHIISDDGFLSSDDQIMLNVVAPSGADTPFIDRYRYRLTIDRSRVIEASLFDGATEPDASLQDHAAITQTLTSKKLHSAALTTGDPWYDTQLLAINSAVSVDYTFDFEEPIDLERDGALDVLLFGSIDLPDERDDHHTRVTVNGVVVDDVTFDGLTEHRTRINLPAGLLKQTGNIVTVTVVGDTGLFADLVLVDQVSVSALSALKGKQRFDYPEQSDVQGYQLQMASSSGDAQAYAYNSDGALSAINVTQQGDTVAFTGLPVIERLATQTRYAVAAQNAWPTADNITLVRGQDLHSKENDYLIVAHPTFIGEDLNEFVAFKTEQGYNVNVIDWLDIVNTYGHGNDTPKALDNFLKSANQSLGAQTLSTPNVLLVGGHTHDFFGITNENIVNFIPSHYRPVNVFEYTATDNPYADLDGDNIPEIAIGRWPVRSVDDLKLIIKKTKDWHQNRQDKTFQDALLIAQAPDGQNLSFSKQLDGRVDIPLQQTDEINQIQKLYLESYRSSGNVIADVRNEIATAINDGVDLVSFNGHGSPISWGFQGVVNTNFIRNLDNAGKPILLMPLACYITHYESVSSNTLAHQWLFSGDRGAAAIHGPSVLGQYRENGIFAERYLRFAKQSKTVGEAILKAKKEMGSNNQMLHNWAYLGDPTLPIR